MVFRKTIRFRKERRRDLEKKMSERKERNGFK